MCSSDLRAPPPGGKPPPTPTPTAPAHGARPRSHARPSYVRALCPTIARAICYRPAAAHPATAAPRASRARPASLYARAAYASMPPRRRWTPHRTRSPAPTHTPADAWKILDAAVVEQRRVVDRIVTAAENAAEVVPESDSLVIFLPYYPSELDYNGGGSWKRANANLRAAYAVLVELGFTVEWTDATDERAFKYVD